MISSLSISSLAICPCGRVATYGRCCGAYHAGEPAPHPESLMRSRYSAYVLGLADYLLATWHASTRPEMLDLSEDGAIKWLGLKVSFASETGDQGEVVFVARYKSNGKAERLSERSRFVREHGRWFYLDGEIA